MKHNHRAVFTIARNTAANTATTDNYKQQAPTTVTTTHNREQSHSTTYSRLQHRPQRWAPLSGHQRSNSNDNQQRASNRHWNAVRRASSNQQHASNQPHVMQTLNCPHAQQSRSLSETCVLHISIATQQWQPQCRPVTTPCLIPTPNSTAAASPNRTSWSG